MYMSPKFSHEDTQKQTKGAATGVYQYVHKIAGAFRDEQLVKFVCGGG